MENQYFAASQNKPTQHLPKGCFQSWTWLRNTKSNSVSFLKNIASNLKKIDSNCLC